MIDALHLVPSRSTRSFNSDWSLDLPLIWKLMQINEASGADH